MKTFCNYYNENVCRSCTLITSDYSHQIAEKENLLRKGLNSLTQVALEKTVASREQHFRNKAKFVVTGTVCDPIIGLGGKDDLDQGTELLDCPLHVSEINELLPELK